MTRRMLLILLRDFFIPTGRRIDAVLFVVDDVPERTEVLIELNCVS